jgi:hypothetical protein
MTRFTKSASGKYVVSGKSFDMLIGTRAQVWHGTAYKTSGGLNKSDLMQNKAGRIVSKSKHSSAKREKRLVKAGYLTKKGKFGFVKVGSKSRKMKGGVGAPSMPLPGPEQMALNASGGARRSRRRMRGGMYALSPSPYAGQGQGLGGNSLDVQMRAGLGN